ncbi:MAG: MFS transporter [Gammaproteobacteria bacterium]|nr:MFS transporter [Gammaproteobacteria bacterium]
MKLKSIIGSSIGNILEWYDFGLFAIFAPFFSQLFFPPGDPYSRTIETFSVFAIGFICRPIGSFIFGYLGDKRGRASTLRLSILMISLPTLLIAFVPTWAQVGILSPILLTLIRIWQGISLGGEYSGNIIYLAETAPSKYRATITSFAATGANLGILLATIIGTLCSFLLPEATLKSYGWRLPYLLSGIISIIIYMTRLNMDETVVFNWLKKKRKLAANPISVAFHKNIPQMFRTLGMVFLGSTFYYFSFIWVPIFLKNQLHYATYFVSGLMSILFVLMLFLVPMAGWLCDQVGRFRLLMFNALAVAILAVPALWLLQTGSFVIVLFILLLFTLISSLEQATTSIAVIENFPVPARYTGLSLSYNIGNGFLGGTVPMVCTWLTAKLHFALSPAFYIAACATVTALVVWFFVPETIHKNLTSS